MTFREGTWRLGGSCASFQVEEEEAHDAHGGEKFKCSLEFFTATPYQRGDVLQREAQAVIRARKYFGSSCSFSRFFFPPGCTFSCVSHINN